MVVRLHRGLEASFDFSAKDKIWYYEEMGRDSQVVVGVEDLLRMTKNAKDLRPMQDATVICFKAQYPVK